MKQSHFLENLLRPGPLSKLNLAEPRSKFLRLTSLDLDAGTSLPPAPAQKKVDNKFSLAQLEEMGDLTDYDAIPSAMDFIPTVVPKKKKSSRVHGSKDANDQMVRRSSRLSKNLSHTGLADGKSRSKSPSTFSCDRFLGPSRGGMNRDLSKMSKWSDVNPLSRYQSRLGGAGAQPAQKADVQDFFLQQKLLNEKNKYGAGKATSNVGSYDDLGRYEAVAEGASRSYLPNLRQKSKSKDSNIGRAAYQTYGINLDFMKRPSKKRTQKQLAKAQPSLFDAFLGASADDQSEQSHVSGSFGPQSNNQRALRNGGGSSSNALGHAMMSDERGGQQGPSTRTRTGTALSQNSANAILNDKAGDKAKVGKRRGRKRERDDRYFEQGYQKIQDILDKLKTAKKDGMPIGERQRLRNQISAQRSRLKKKEENLFLNRKVREKDRKFQDLIESLAGILNEGQAKALWDKVCPKWKKIDDEDNIEEAVITPSGVKVPKKKKTRTATAQGVQKLVKQLSQGKKLKGDPLSPTYQLATLMFGTSNPDENPFLMNSKLPSPFGGAGLNLGVLKTTLLSQFVTPESAYEHFKQNDEKIYDEDFD